MPLHHSHQTCLLHHSTHLPPSQEWHFLDVLWIHHNHQSSCCNSAIGTYEYISSFLRHTDSHCCGSTTFRLRTFRLRHFVYRHFVYRLFVYYCIPACRTVIHPTSVSANHYSHQFQLLITLRFLFINPTSTDTMIIQHM